MAILRLGDLSIRSNPGESVLDALLRHGVAPAYSCRAGVCQSCLLRCVDGAIPARAQLGLRDSLRSQGYFLACACVPDGDLVISAADDPGLSCAVDAVALDRLSPSVVRLRLRPLEHFAYRAGQFVSLVRGDGLTRSYSLASLPDRDEFLELHVRELPEGRMSRWIARELRIGEPLRIRGPAGECFYSPGDPGRELLLAGTGTGLAPLYAIARDALHAGHSGPIHLIHGAVSAEGLYLIEELRALERRHANFFYTRCLLRGEPGDGVVIGALPRVVKERFPAPKSLRSYLCGDPGLVHELRRALFLAGASLREIFADPFITAAPPARVE
jgi:CDP-4-dehydro-6-deoxyglucose reductase